MTEYEAWTLMAAFFTSNAVFFLGLIVAVWLGFRTVSYTHLTLPTSDLV